MRKLLIAGASLAVIAVLIATVRCTLCRSGPVEPDGGQGDEHARMCAKRHPVFPRLKVKQGSPGGIVPKSTRLPSATKAAAAVSADDAPEAPEPSPVPDLGDGDPTEALLTGNCPKSGCGLNGTWLGAGVPFRTLHFSPYRHNDINLSVLAFRGPAGRDGRRASLTLDVEGDVLHAAGRPSVEPGSVLELGAPETPGGPSHRPTYELTITNVHQDQFWIAKDCPNGSNDPRCQPETFPVYDFSARSLDDDCPLEVCDPELDGSSSSASPNLIGTAVIFRGDYYNDDYTVGIAPPSTYDNDVFNIACLGTAISKMHRFRHTSAAKITPIDPPPPPVDRRQALLRLLTADYCGAGHPFTIDGVPLRINFDSQQVFDAPGYGPTPGPTGSGFVFSTSPGATVDAIWNADGASCIGQPRLQTPSRDLWPTIREICRLVNHPATPCVAAGPVPATLPIPTGSFVESQNP